MKILITKSENSSAVRILSYDDNELVLNFTTGSDGNYVGNIYVGHVENIVTNLNACFVRFKSDSPKARDNIGYLSLEDIVPCCVIGRNYEESPKLRDGDIVLVQVSKPAVKTKQAFLTTKLSISGSYVAITLGQKGVGCSKKLPESRRKEIISLFKNDFSIKNRISDKYGLIARTKCIDVHDDVFAYGISQLDTVRAEVDLLCDKIDEMVNIASGRSAGSCLYEMAIDSDFSDKLLNCLNFYIQKKSAYENFLSIESQIEVVMDDAELFTMFNASSFHKEHLGVRARLLGNNDGTIRSLYGPSLDLEKLLQKKAWLKSGAYLVIESTEAMHVIDVNTGKSIGKKGNLFLDINIEAAIESARQIRLRNLFGMILIDFINMNDQKDYKKLEEVLKKELSFDPIKTIFVDFTKLGIAEITRIKKT